MGGKIGFSDSGEILDPYAGLYKSFAKLAEIQAEQMKAFDFIKMLEPLQRTLNDLAKKNAVMTDAFTEKLRVYESLVVSVPVGMVAVLDEYARIMKSYDWSALQRELYASATLEKQLDITIDAITPHIHEEPLAEGRSFKDVIKKEHENGNLLNLINILIAIYMIIMGNIQAVKQENREGLHNEIVQKQHEESIEAMRNIEDLLSQIVENTNASELSSKVENVGDHLETVNDTVDALLDKVDAIAQAIDLPVETADAQVENNNNSNPTN